MHIMKKYLQECIDHTEKHMDHKHFDDMSSKEKDYILACVEHCLEVAKLLDIKRHHNDGSNAHANNSNNPMSAVNL